MKKLQKYHKGTHTYIKWDKNTKQVIKDRKIQPEKPPAIGPEIPEGLSPDRPNDFLVHLSNEVVTIDFTRKEAGAVPPNISLSLPQAITSSGKLVRRIILTPANAKRLYFALTKFKLT